MFSESQTFLIDSSSVSGAKEIGLTKVRLYFRAKPNATGNKSGIEQPGVTLYIMPTLNGIPDIRNLDVLPFTRVEYASIQVSSDATAFTDFTFPSPVLCQTDREWAFGLKYDGEEDFILWKSKKGDTLVSSDIRSPGSSGEHVGNYFSFIGGPITPEGNPVGEEMSPESSSSGGGPATQEYLESNWKPITDVDIKFTVFCARYRHNGSSDLTGLVPENTPPEAVISPGSIFAVANAEAGSFGYRIPSKRYEHILYDRKISSQGSIDGGQTAWQKGPYYPNEKNPHHVSVTSGSEVVTTSDSNFSQLFGDSPESEYIIVVSEDHDGPGLHTAAARKVAFISSNTSIELEEAFPFTNAAAKFYKAPVGIVDAIGNRLFSQQHFVLSLIDSNANSSVRFVNNAIESITIDDGGTGYDNTDVITISGFEHVSGKVIGGYNATAVITTNSAGGIISAHLANAGAGFVNSASISFNVANSTGGSTTGSGAQFSAETGMTVFTEQAYRGIDGYVSGGKLINPDVTTTIIPVLLRNPLGTIFKSYVRFPYYMIQDSEVFGGVAYHCDDSDSENDVIPVVIGKLQTHDFSKRRVLASWSNELVTTFRGSGDSSEGRGTSSNSGLNVVPGTSNSMAVWIDAVSNNDFVSIIVPPFVAGAGRFNINNDYTDENTNYGNALAKGITKKFGFSNGAFAEDIRLILTAYRPNGTDIKVFARIHNSTDEDSFDDKDWTLLDMNEDGRVHSSRSDPNDYVELTFGFRKYPNTEITISGQIATSNDSTDIVGTGTDFDQHLANGDMVKIYSDLFPNNYMISLVNSVSNATHLTITSPVTNTSLIQSDLKIDKIEYPQQAFSYILNDNVVRYYSKSLVEYDGYDTIQLKIVLLSENNSRIPRVGTMRMLGISA